MPLFHGPDVSHYQGANFPWAALVQTHGIRLGACKMTEGTGYVDPTGVGNRKAMKAAGLRWRGLYHFARQQDPAGQVAHFVGLVGELEPGEFVMIDVEVPMSNSVADVMAVLQAFEARYPGRVVRYQGKWFALGDSDVYAQWPWWLPAYTKVMPATHLPVTLWQWAGGLSGVDVPGVGRVDSNAVIDETTLDRVAGVTAGEPPLTLLPPLLPPVVVVPVWPSGLVPLYTEEDGMAAPYRITNPHRATQLIRWPSGALGWCSHAEAGMYPDAHEETDDATFNALISACTVPPVPPGQ